MLLFDIGANRGDAVVAGLNMGFDKVIALEPAPVVFKELVSNFLYDSRVIPLRFAVSERDGETVEFYECVEDGLSTLEKSWLTDPKLPYAGKKFRTIRTNTCTMDWLVEQYGTPDLAKIDVEGAESQVFAGMTCKPKQLAFEWSIQTIDQHVEQLKRLRDVNGYTEYALQYITNHLVEPENYLPLTKADKLPKWIKETEKWWTSGGWEEQGRLRPTADVGMLWLR
jgi:FkbM family methyltransferase